MPSQPGSHLEERGGTVGESTPASSLKSLPKASPTRPVQIHRRESLTPAEISWYYRKNTVPAPGPTTSTQVPSQTVTDALRYEPVSTSRCFQDFKSVVERLEQLKDVTEQYDLDLEARSLQRNKQREVLKRLRAWRDWQDTQFLSRNFRLESWWKTLLSDKPEIPQKEQLIDLVKHFYPLRADVKVYICDFGLNQFKRTSTTLADIERCMNYSPFTRLYSHPCRPRA